MLIARYILRAHSGPFVFSLVTLMFIFLLQFIMKFIDQLVGKGLSAWVIMELIALSLAWMLVLAVPMSVLVAVLMAFGDMSSKNEITAMKASGVSLYRMLAPVLAAGGVVCAVMIWFNNAVLPEATHHLKVLTSDIRRKRPTLTLVDGVFSQDIPGYSILVRKASPATNELEGITLYDYTTPQSNVVVTARTGSISFSADFRKILVDLRNGEIHRLDLEQPHLYRRIRFTTHRIAMAVEGFDFERSSTSAFTRGDREMSAGDMLAVVDSLRGIQSKLEEGLRKMMLEETSAAARGEVSTATMPPGAPPELRPPAEAVLRARMLNTEVTTSLFRIQAVDQQIDQYLVEVHKKYSLPVACIVFVLVGVPVGIMSRRGGFGIAATLSLGFFVLYWACLIGGEKLADRAILSPFWGMWMANILLGAIGLYLLFRAGRETMLIPWDIFTRLVPERLRARWRTEAPSGTVHA